MVHLSNRPTKNSHRNTFVFFLTQKKPPLRCVLALNFFFLSKTLNQNLFNSQPFHVIFESCVHSINWSFKTLIFSALLVKLVWQLLRRKAEVIAVCNLTSLFFASLVEPADRDVTRSAVLIFDCGFVFFAFIELARWWFVYSLLTIIETYATRSFVNLGRETWHPKIK